MTHPYLKRIGPLQQAAHALASILSTRFEWSAIIYAASPSIELEVASLCLVSVCPGTVQVSTKVEWRIPEDELFIVVRSRVNPVAAMSFDRGLFCLDPDQDVPWYIDDSLRSLFPRILVSENPHRAGK